MRWIKIRKAIPEDVDEIWELDKICFTTPWSRNEIEKEITENILANYVVAITDNKIISYAGIWVVLNEGHITNVAVHPEYRGEGIATMTFMELLSMAREKGAERFTLEVRRTNETAIALYEKFGFEIVGYRKQYYADTKEDALIMWLYNDEVEIAEEGNDEGR